MPMATPVTKTLSSWMLPNDKNLIGRERHQLSFDDLHGNVVLLASRHVAVVGNGSPHACPNRQ